MRWPGTYLRPARRVSVPSSVFGLEIQTQEVAHGAAETISHREWSGCHAVRRRRDHGRWTRPVESSHDSADDLFGWLQAHADRTRRNYVVTWDCSAAAVLSGWWERAETHGLVWEPRGKGGPKWGAARPGRSPVVVRRLAIDGRIGIVDYSFDGVRWVWLSVRNYFGDSPERIAESIGFEWPDTPTLGAASPLYARTVRDRAHLWCAVMVALSDWWTTSARAPLGLTAGQCAVGVLRSHVGRGDLCTHSCEGAHDLERAAGYGGRASVWYYGDVGDPAAHHTHECPAPAPSRYGSIPGPAVMVDVRSMYPTLLRDRRYPVALVGYRPRCPASEPQALANGMGVIARVRIVTDCPEFPRRTPDRVTYPVGEFWTTLTGAELLHLRGRGRVAQCEGIAVYRLGSPFSAAASALLDMRADARRDGRSAWELFAKLIANSLGGKLAQRGGRWVERRGRAAPVPWGEWTEAGDSPGSVRRFRAIAGLVWEWDREQGRPAPFAAAFSYLTAFGRIQMHELRERLGVHSVYAQDTDGMWVAPAAVDSLTAACGPESDEPGGWTVKQVVQAARWYGARHYWTPVQWVLSGLHDPVVSPDGSTVTDTYTPSPIARARHGAPRTVSVKGRSCVIDVRPGPGRIGPDGWQEPPRVRHG